VQIKDTGVTAAGYNYGAAPALTSAGDCDGYKPGIPMPPVIFVISD